MIGAAAMLVLCASTALAAELDLRVTGLRGDAGKVFFGVFNAADGFLDDERRFARAVVPVVDGTARVALTLPPGRYAITAFHDANDNGALDTNFLGIPTEPYGFSRGVRPMLSAPSFESAAIELTDTGARETIALE
jgi:uncharacterized protein (DUF2141 family)